MSYIDRQCKLQRFLAENGLDAILIRKRQNIAYLTGTNGDDARLFVSPRENILFTDSRHLEEYGAQLGLSSGFLGRNTASHRGARFSGARHRGERPLPICGPKTAVFPSLRSGLCWPRMYKKTIKHCRLRIVKPRELSGAIEDACRQTRSKAIGFESNTFTYFEYLNLKKSLKHRKLAPLKDVVENLRMIKDRKEIECIRQACIDACRVMNHAISIVKPGLKENAARAEIEMYVIKKGLILADFDIILASGRNSSMPHAPVSDKIIKRQEMVTIDLGTKFNGYNSDLTRTVFLGRIDPRYSRIYKVVLDAQKKAIEKIKPGICAMDIDAVSRQYISKKGMGRHFLHSLGHGIGRETHEIPAISQNSKIRLAKGMVITVEPGVYIHGWGGVRIEDVVLVTENGCEVLTSALSYKP